MGSVPGISTFLQSLGDFVPVDLDAGDVDYDAGINGWDVDSN